MFWVGVSIPIQRTGSSVRGGGHRGRRSSGSWWKAKYPGVVCDEELNKCSLVTGLQQGDHRHVCSHQRAQ